MYFLLKTLYTKSLAFQDFNYLLSTGNILGNAILLVFCSYHFTQLFYELKKQLKFTKVLFWLNVIPVVMMNIVFLQRLFKHLSFSTLKNQILFIAPVLLAFHVYDFIYYQAQTQQDEDLKDVIDF